MLIDRDGVPVGMNTDGTGCIRHIERAGYSFDGACVAICGTGPTSLAILQAAAAAGAAVVVLVGRDKGRSEQVLGRFIETYRGLAYATIDIASLDEGHRSFREAYEEPDYLFGSYTTSTSALKDADIIIDATPLGMHEDDPLPFAEDLLGSQSLVYDVVYGHGPSKLLATAQQAGCGVLDGRGMLVAQAAENAMSLLQLEGVDVMPSWDDMFSIMAKAAGFPC
jgi:shikimate 5-dehydrogenase